MAINRVIEPNVPPTETADWSRMLNLVRSLELRAGDSNIVDWPSLTIKKGAVFFLGGTVYQADADATISGTASSFVKLTPSSDGSVCTASYVTSSTGVSWNSTYNGWYDADGNLYVFQAALPDRPHIARFESSGTFVVPRGIDTIYISGCAAGGNGGTAPSNSNEGGGGGGGGECAFRMPLSVTPGQSIAVSIGGIGANTTVGGSFTLNYGKSASGATPGLGGAISSGNVRGGNGGYSSKNGLQACGGGGVAGETYSPASTFGGGGGGGGGYFSQGADGASGAVSGGSALCGGGGGGGYGGVGGNGGYGGGGGGGGEGGGAGGGAGGSGGPALIIIEW